MTQRHSNLVAWQRADDLFVEVHRLTKSFPADERFELCSEIRRAAYSVPANIVEGVARRSPKERLHYLNVAEASLAEVGYCLHVAAGLVTSTQQLTRRSTPTRGKRLPPWSA
jgi:four helix bundle protein